MKFVDLCNAFETELTVVTGDWVDRDGNSYHAPEGFVLLVDAEDEVIAMLRDDVATRDGVLRSTMIAEMLNKWESFGRALEQALYLLNETSRGDLSGNPKAFITHISTELLEDPDRLRLTE